MGVKVREWKGGWWVFVNHRGRRKAKRVGPLKRDAEAVASKLREAITKGAFNLPDETAPTFAELGEDWLRTVPTLRSLRQSSVEIYTSFYRTHLVPFFGHRRVSEITPELIEEFITLKLAPGGSARFQDKPLAKTTVRVGLIALRLILQRAVRAKWLPASPMAAVEVRLQKNAEKADPLTGPELRRILASARQINPDFATMLRLWAQTGMRAGELCGLRWSDLDLDRGEAVVERTWSRGRLGPTKTGQVRKVSLFHPVMEDTSDWRPTPLSRSILSDLRRLKVRSLDPEGFVFGNGQSPMPPAVLHREWRRVLTLAEVRYRTPEQLRHSWCSALLSRNAPLLYVQKQGGWKSATVLLRVYARWLPDAMEVAPSATPAQPRARPVIASAQNIDEMPRAAGANKTTLV